MEIVNAMMILINENTVEPAYSNITYDRFCPVVREISLPSVPFFCKSEQLAWCKFLPMNYDMAIHVEISGFLN